MTRIGISGTRWLIDGSITYPGAADDDPETYSRLRELTFPP